MVSFANGFAAFKEKITAREDGPAFLGDLLGAGGIAAACPPRRRGLRGPQRVLPGPRSSGDAGLSSREGGRGGGDAGRGGGAPLA